MKLNFKETLINGASALAVVTTFIFGTDVVSIVQDQHTFGALTLPNLALLMGLICLTCVAAASCLLLAHTAAQVVFDCDDPHQLLVKTAQWMSGAMICFAFTFNILIEVFPKRSLSNLVIALALSTLSLLGLLQLAPFKFINDLWSRACHRKPFLILTLLSVASVFFIIDAKDLFEGNISAQRALQLCMLMGAIGSMNWFLKTRISDFERKILCVVCALQLGTGVGVLWNKTHPSAALVTFESNSAAAQQSLALLRWADDADGDGFAANYGGGDCNDNNPKINPHAKEIAGNGLDDNCMGGDSTPVDAVVKTQEEPPVIEDESQRMSVVLIIADTLRADRVLYGPQDRDTAPNLARWSRKSARFLRAYAQAPHTPRSLPSMFAGRYPSRMRWVNSFENYPVPHQTERFVTQDLSDAGYATASVTSHWYFSRVPSVLRGFDRNRILVETYRQQTDAMETTDVGLKELERLNDLDKPFFLLVHYIDPHEPYRVRGKNPVFGERRLVDRYDGEVHYFDRQVNRLLTRVEEMQSSRRVAVIVTSDHGEAFREHGLLYHGRTLYNEEIHVPLLIRAPGFKASTIPYPVGLVDLAATIRRFANLEVDSSDGEALQGMMLRPESRRFSALFSELLPYPRYNQHRLAAISKDGRWKLIRNLTRNTIELFELGKDPSEKRNIFSKSNPVLADLKEDLEHFVDGRPTRSRAKASAEKRNHQSTIRLRKTTKRGGPTSNL